MSQWFEHADIPGHGNTEVSDTQNDPTVRTAREIPSQRFSVEPTLLRKIEKIWGKNLLPSTVRAEPYKVYLYGPGDRFQLHLDAPEKGLVGTFLLGLSSWVMQGGNFMIDGEQWYSPVRGAWAAFHTDVVPEITEVKYGYCGFIAFKIFHADPGYQNQLKLDDLNAGETPRLVGEALKRLTLPFGIEFTHYSKSMTEPTGFDALLLDVVRQLPDVSVHTIPILTAVKSVICFGDQSFSSNVYPLTDAHLDFLLSDADALKLDESNRWLDKLQLGNIPFYSLVQDSGKTWTSDVQDIIDGDVGTENSIYLNHAMVVLPVTSPNDQLLSSS